MTAQWHSLSRSRLSRWQRCHTALAQITNRNTKLLLDVLNRLPVSSNPFILIRNEKLPGIAVRAEKQKVAALGRSEGDSRTGKAGERGQHCQWLRGQPSPPPSRRVALHGGASADEVAVPVHIVDAPDRRPELTLANPRRGEGGGGAAVRTALPRVARAERGAWRGRGRIETNEPPLSRFAALLTRPLPCAARA